jgi:hypothetical protein
MTLTKPQMALILASAITLYFTWVALKSDDAVDIALPTRTASKANAAAKAADKPTSFSLQVSLQDRDLVPLTGDLFAAPKLQISTPVYKSKSAVVAAAPPAPKPIAPPLPFTYFGRFQDDDKNAVMIEYLDEIIVIKVGDIVAKQYKVVAINQSASGMQIQFLMMPLNQIQTMQARAGQP